MKPQTEPTPTQRASIIFEAYRSDDKSKWEPAFDEVVKIITELEAAQAKYEEQKRMTQRAVQINNSLASDNAELRKDKERLDWLQQGHCVLALCKWPETNDGSHLFQKPTGVEFEIDGYQNCPKSENVRTAIDQAMQKGDNTK